MEKKVTCPCCGYKTIEEEYDICPICSWENDLIQKDDPDYSGGANGPSLKEAQRNFKEFGAVEKRLISQVKKPNSKDREDKDFRPY